MFEQSIKSFEEKVKERYGDEGIEILKEFRNKEILDTINSMSDEELETFYQVIEKNFFETEILLNGCIRNCYLPEEERFDYDSFYHTCYQKISTLIGKGNKREIKYEALKYKEIIDNIKASIKSISDVKKCFIDTYKVKDERKITLAKKIYQFKKQIENYLKKLIKENGFSIDCFLTINDIYMLIQGVLNGISDQDVLSKLSFVSEEILASLELYEKDFKEILENLTLNENNNIASFIKQFEKEELELYLYITSGLTKTKSVSEENLLDTIFSEESFEKNLDYQKRYSME